MNNVVHMQAAVQRYLWFDIPGRSFEFCMCGGTEACHSVWARKIISLFCVAQDHSVCSRLTRVKMAACEVVIGDFGIRLMFVRRFVYTPH